MQEQRQHHPAVQILQVLRRANLEALEDQETNPAAERKAQYFITLERKPVSYRRWIDALYYSSGYER